MFSSLMFTIIIFRLVSSRMKRTQRGELWTIQTSWQPRCSQIVRHWTRCLQGDFSHWQEGNVGRDSGNILVLLEQRNQLPVKGKPCSVSDVVPFSISLFVRYYSEGIHIKDDAVYKFEMKCLTLAVWHSSYYIVECRPHPGLRIIVEYFI